ncbi:hypothetical protein Ahy_B08g090354 [Arachis hypogaea]|uniref:adenine phosphoribosyltransferase n=1 Tax=Arachis hypogaea TaxID=3818 RepID=A0A444Y023_ARAHY|nr:hypothetical protein Ahy_B08g090354 [Arachis hypogaea]
MAIDFDLNTVPMAEGAKEFEQQTDSPDEIVASQSISENMKNYTSSDEVINQAIGDEELDPEEGMCFGTLEDARAYYYQYAARTGFVVKIRTTGWKTRNDQRVVINLALHCNRDGYRTSCVKAPKRRKTVASINCKARCYLALDKMTGQWSISLVEVSHLHPLNPTLSRMFSANRKLSMHVKDLIQQNDQAGIRLSKMYQALANAVGGPANLTFTENDVRESIIKPQEEEQANSFLRDIIQDPIEESEEINQRSSYSRIEARGFIFGPPIALAIGAKLVPLRKPKKLPGMGVKTQEGCIIGLMAGKVISQEYILEYGRDCLEMHVGAVEAGEHAIVVDDLITTGGTLCATIDLLEVRNGEMSFFFVYVGELAIFKKQRNWFHRCLLRQITAIWGSILAGATSYSNAGLAAEVLHHLIKLEPHNSGNYSLLSNMYASLGRWSKARMVRKAIRDTGVEKMPGVSFIEVNNKVYEFIAGDKSGIYFVDIVMSYIA